MNRSRGQRGAALLLLVAVMGVGGAALFISALSHSQLEARREQRTMVTLAQAQDALLGYAIRFGRLPRPAVSATDGRESPRLCGDDAACTGFLPWVTLGVDGADAWGKLLVYSVTPRYTLRPIEIQSAVPTKTVQARATGGRLFYLAGTDLCAARGPCSPAIVYSTGKNNLGTSTLGLAQANGASGNVDELNNAFGATHYVQRPATDDPGAPGGVYDDLVSWMPLPLLYVRMFAAGQLQ